MELHASSCNALESWVTVGSGPLIGNLLPLFDQCPKGENQKLKKETAAAAPSAPLTVGYLG